MSEFSRQNHPEVAAPPAVPDVQTERDPLTPVAAVRPRRPLSELIAYERARRQKRNLYRWLALGALTLIAAVGWFALRPETVPLAERFRTQPAVQSDVVREVLATGNVAAVTTVQVGAEISGRVVSVAVDFNASVKKGQIMASFDRAILKAQLAQAEGGLSSAKSQLDQARTDFDKAATDLARAERLHASKVISEADYEAAVTNARRSEQRVAAARAQVETQQGAADLARTNLNHANIVAPIDGIVITRNIDPGQTVASVLQTPVLFTVAQDLSKMRVIAAVDEADIGMVSIGQRALFTVDAYPERLFEGLVTEVRNSPVVVQDVVTYGTVIEVTNRDLALKPGMTAAVRIRTAEVKNALNVPAAALNFVPPNERPGTNPSVWVVSETGLRRIAVKPDISNGESTAVTAEGLKLGDRVVVDLTPKGRAAYGNGS